MHAILPPLPILNVCCVVVWSSWRRWERGTVGETDVTEVALGKSTIKRVSMRRDKWMTMRKNPTTSSAGERSLLSVERETVEPCQVDDGLGG